MYRQPLYHTWKTQIQYTLQLSTVLTIKPPNRQPFSNDRYLIYQVAGYCRYKCPPQSFMRNKLEPQVVLDFQQANEKAFELVFKEYYTQLVVFTAKITGSQDEAEDIVTEVFLGLFKRCNMFDSEPNIRAFLYVSCRNRCLNYLKSKKRHDVRSLEFAEEIKDDTLLEYEYSIMAEIVEAVQNSIDNLPEECQRIFKMLYYEELKPAEVAARLQISVNTVYVQKSRAISMLRLKLGDHPVIIAWLFYILSLLKNIF
ncbi:RNA polymerase sigma-70 factor (family 1) [Chitinophagaceae bacterium OAS944]